ncbi:MAG: hypothetical protein K0U37_05090 [Gammaproteobacteria bacterium]|nr:hypothetical protein [Gammaproteobacteria bacterium]
MTRLIRFCSLAAFLVHIPTISYALEMFNTQASFSQAELSLEYRLRAPFEQPEPNEPLAIRAADYSDATLMFTTDSPTLEMLTSGSNGMLTGNFQNAQGEDTTLALGSFQRIFHTPYRSLASLPSNSIMAQLLMTPSQFSPVFTRILGPQRTVHAIGCLAPGLNCQKLTLKTNPRIVFGLIRAQTLFSAPQITQFAYGNPQAQTGIQRPLAFDYDLKRRNVWSLEGRADIITKWSVDPVTGLFYERRQETAYVGTGASDITVSPTGNVAFIADDSGVTTCSGTGGVWSNCKPLPNTGAPLANIRFVKLNVTGRMLWAISRTDAALFGCPINQATGITHCKKFTNTGPVLTLLGRPAFIGTRMAIAAGDTVAACQVNMADASYACLSVIDFGAPVTGISNPIDVDLTPGARQASFVVTLRDTSEAYPSTVQTLTIKEIGDTFTATATQATPNVIDAAAVSPVAL